MPKQMLQGKGGSGVNGKITAAIYSVVLWFCFGVQAAAQEVCFPPAGLSEVTSNKDVRFVVFGETHGTAESPALFAESVCAVVLSGKRVLVGLEFPEVSANVFQQFLQSSGDPEDVKKLLEGSSWSSQASRFPDGRTSHAMLDMVQRLRGLRASGYELSIAPFVRVIQVQGESQTPYEKGLASTLMDARSSGSYDLVMVLVGNMHAFKGAIRAGTPFEPMAVHLPQNETITLNMVSDGGTAWNCRARDDCGEHPLRDSNTRKIAGILLEKTMAPGYDGVFSIGAASASPPVTETP